MKVKLIATGLFTLSCITSPVMAQSSDCLIEDKSKRLVQIDAETQTVLSQLSNLRNCAQNYDDLRTSEQTKKIQQDAQEILSQKVNALSSDLANLLAEIMALVKQLDVANVKPNLNEVLAERLAYREKVKSWPLRNSYEVDSLSSDLRVVEGEIVALRAQLNTTSEWNDRANLDTLIMEERQLTQIITQLQSRLSKLQQKRKNPDYDSAKQLQNEGPERRSALASLVQEILNQINGLKVDIANQVSELDGANDRINQLDRVFASATEKYEDLKLQLSNSTQDLTSTQIEKSRLIPNLQSLEERKTILTTNLEQMLPQVQATQAIVDQLQLNISDKSEEIAEFDEQIAKNTKLVKELQDRVETSNRSITAIRSDMSTLFKPLGDLQNVENQVFALELTIDGLEEEINNLDMLTSGAEGKLNRFIRTCKREPACKSALNL